MKIASTYSHLNGHEFLLVHQPTLWDEVVEVIKGVNATACRTKISKEKTMHGSLLHSPTAMNKCFKEALVRLGWRESRVQYWVTQGEQLIRKTLALAPAQQKAEIEAAGKKPIKSYNQTDFVKNRVAIEIQFGKYSFVAYDLFVKHMAFYVGDQIDVGIEILPMKLCSLRCPRVLLTMREKSITLSGRAEVFLPFHWLLWASSQTDRVLNDKASDDFGACQCEGEGEGEVKHVIA